MWDYLWKYAIVYLWATVKFVVAPVTAYATNLGWFESSLLTIAGMMTTVIVVSVIGEQIKIWVRKRKEKSGKKTKVFTRKNRFIVKIWTRFGIYGISFLTPILFSPIVGSILAVTLEPDKKRIWLIMLFAASFWAFVISIGLELGGQQVLKLLGR